MRIRSWAEFLPVEEAMADATVDLLRRFDVQLCLSVQHGANDSRLARLLKIYADAGLEVALWLLLPKAEGYWPSERNHAAFKAHLEAVFAWADRERVRVPWIAVDLELPLPQVVRYRPTRGISRHLAMLRMALSNLDRRRFDQAVAAYRDVLATIHGHGAKALCAAHDFVAEDLRLGAPVVQDFLETPVLDVPWDLVSFMIYNSLVSGEFGCSIEDARWMQYDVSLELKAALGPRTGLSLGLTSVGVLGNERFYASPAELAPDVGAAKAAGIDDIAIFSLEGILRSRDPAGWLEVVRDTPPSIPPRTGWATRERGRRRAMASAMGWVRQVPRGWR